MLTFHEESVDKRRDCLCNTKIESAIKCFFLLLFRELQAAIRKEQQLVADGGGWVRGAGGEGVEEV